MWKSKRARLVSLYLRKADKRKGRINEKIINQRKKGYLNPRIGSVKLLDPHLDLSDLIRQQQDI